MNAAVVLLIVLVGAQALSKPDALKAEWEAYKLKYKKKYSPSEDIWRFKLYKKTKVEITAHNKLYTAGKVTWKMGINEFADMTDKELSSKNFKPFT